MNDDVLVRVEGVSKKLCLSLKKSLWYGMQYLGKRRINDFNWNTPVLGLRNGSKTIDTTLPAEVGHAALRPNDLYQSFLNRHLDRQFIHANRQAIR